MNIGYPLMCFSTGTEVIGPLGDTETRETEVTGRDGGDKTFEIEEETPGPFLWRRSPKLTKGVVCVG